MESSGSGAFWGAAMRSLTIADGIESIGPYAFIDCMQLSGTLTLPGNQNPNPRYSHPSVLTLPPP
jgi:hypothetical protein